MTTRAVEYPPGAIKTDEQIERIARAGEVVARALRCAADHAAPGVTTGEIDSVVRRELSEAGATALFLGYHQGNAPAFPGAACVSVNNEVVHGIPGERVLRAGDVVSIDVGARVDGWCADAATTVIIGGDTNGSVSAEEVDARRALVETLRSALDACIDSIGAGVRWLEVAGRLEDAAMRAGLGMVVEYIGHGIGRELHEWPRVPAYRTGFGGDDFVLAKGMVLAIEPIFTARSDGISTCWRGRPSNAVGVSLEGDGWTVVTKGGMVAAHEERTVVVTGGAGAAGGAGGPGGAGCRILTPVELAPV